MKVKMKSIILLIILIMTSCSIKNKNSQISGNISFSNEILKDTLNISLFYSPIQRNYNHQPIKQYTQIDTTFSFTVDPDKYILKISSKGSSTFKTNIFVPDNNTNIGVNISLSSTDEKSKADVSGFEFHNEYNQLLNDLRAFDKSIFLLNMKTAKRDDYEKHYKNLCNKLDSLEEKYDPYFNQLFVEKKLSHMINFHPLTYDLRMLFSNGEVDSLKWISFYKTDTFQNFYTEKSKLLEKIDPKSLLLNGDFFIAITRFDFLSNQIPLLLKEKNIENDHYYQFILEFINKSSNKFCCSNLLNVIGSMYIHEKSSEKGVKLLNLLKYNYPDYIAVKTGSIDKALKSLEVKVGYEAPNFSLRTITGDSLNLNNYKGKFVFLDFWGTWCEPCREEVNNIQNLYKSISIDTLVVIGVARDNRKKLMDFILQRELTYKNAIATESILTDYGINFFPTSFLISPEGKINSKGLRGTDLVKLVRDDIMKYYKKHITKVMHLKKNASRFFGNSLNRRKMLAE